MATLMPAGCILLCLCCVCVLTVLLSLWQTADKRKAMLDELAIETAQEKSRHKEELSDLRLHHEKEVLSIRARYEKELRGLHEDKNRTEEEIRTQLRDEKVTDLAEEIVRNRRQTCAQCRPDHESCLSINTCTLMKI